MLQAIDVSTKMADYESLKQLYLRAFPREERFPLFFLIRQTKKAGIRFQAWYDGPTFVGLTYIITYQGMTYLLFLAVNDQIRSKGYGSQILKAIAKIYRGNTITLLMEEVVTSAPNYQQRLKRQEFYFKNGFRDSRHTTVEYGVKYQMLVLGSDFTAKQYRDLFIYFVGPFVYRFYGTDVV
ncbi:hypothetical protein FC83_GL002987 [Agrilactobacillus composti DSM 18527 = JCM 14202]|uniref:N-acetyltransferase domain-containing protein n=1 Tax=Agrilactobacillus composti DSM 18527 = JCM 14202 TaxID=1423734 RepID=X0PQH5_9LACO|nr:GNAT family N-acetyltransferase [Agrilactobacillus composti]KRM36236.1 hypothetical protein FC83_GL002987 [Agrilactobacillus composti DSM 18527 = JCM 14202]GAF39972.1 hypothetical protein JCM14202_1855 [Agrilactobacillus composti DSM 18527 = JCM 14202]